MSTEEEEDPLESLLVDKDQINRKRLTNILKDYVGIDRESGDLIRFSDFYDLDTGRRITAILLAQKAAALLGVIDEDEQGLTSEELGNYAEVASATVRNHANDKKFIQQDRQHGGYHIPDIAINQALDFLEKER